MFTEPVLARPPLGDSAGAIIAVAVVIGRSGRFGRLGLGGRGDRLNVQGETPPTA